MATSTSNLGLQKPDYSDAADIAVLNGNSDKIDSSVNATDGAIAIVSNGNTHPQIPSGAYVYIRGHGSLSEGLYKNSTSGTIGVNATLSTSNVSAISSGGMNEMKSITDTLNGNINTLGVILTGDKNSATLSVPNNTATLVSSIVLTKGVWAVVGCADWASNENGYRQIAFDSEALNPGRNASTTTNGISSKEAYQQLVFLKVTNGETMNMYARQTSGSSLNLYPYLYATKVGL